MSGVAALAPSRSTIAPRPCHQTRPPPSGEGCPPTPAMNDAGAASPHTCPHRRLLEPSRSLSASDAPSSSPAQQRPDKPADNAGSMCPGSPGRWHIASCAMEALLALASARTGCSGAGCATNAALDRQGLSRARAPSRRYLTRPRHPHIVALAAALWGGLPVDGAWGRQLDARRPPRSSPAERVCPPGGRGAGAPQARWWTVRRALYQVSPAGAPSRFQLHEIVGVTRT